MRGSAAGEAPRLGEADVANITAGEPATAAVLEPAAAPAVDVAPAPGQEQLVPESELASASTPDSVAALLPERPQVASSDTPPSRARPHKPLELPPRGSDERKLLDWMVRFAEAAYGAQIDRRIAQVRCAENEAGFDPFGFDPETARYVLAAVTFMHRTYFRTQVFGLENVPPGRSLLISNHSGMVPIDGILIAASLLLDGSPARLARGMVEKWTQQLPYVAMLFARVGQVLGSPDNARRLLEAGHPLMVFPEGVRGIVKPYTRRYQLADFGLGFMRLALETKSPVVPIAVIGAEEQYPNFGNASVLARLLGLPMFPLLPQALIGLALPLPTRYRIYFGEPLHFEGDPDDDDAEIEAHVQLVRDTVQNMVVRGLGERKHIFW